MDRLISLDELLRFPIRADHCDKEHANEDFIDGIETVFEYVETLPTVDAIPVKFIKGELEHLRANRVDADPDDVDYAWDLKMKIEALSDLLGAWEDTYETD